MNLRKDEDKQLDAKLVIIKNDIKLALKIMVPVEGEAWKYVPRITRDFSQKEYEIVRNLLLAYQEIVS